MPSAVKSGTALGEGGSARAGSVGVRKPTTLDVPKKRPQLLVSNESSQRLKSVGPRSGGMVAASNGSSVGSGSGSTKLADKSVRQKVDLGKPAAAAASRIVSTRLAAVKSTRPKPHSGEPVMSEPHGNTESRTAVKMTRTSGGMTQLSTAAAKTAVHRKSVLETCRHEDSSSSANKRKSATVTTSVSSGVKQEVPLSRSVRVAAAAACQSKASGTAAACIATKKPRLKQGNDPPLMTGRTLVKHDRRAPSSVEQNKDKQDKTGDEKPSSSKGSSSSACVSKVAELSTVSAVEGGDMISDKVKLLNNVVDGSQEPLPAVSSNGSVHSDCVVNESCEDLQPESSDQISYHSESPMCESVRSSLTQCEHILTSNSIIVPVTCIHENSSDLEETSVCDVSLHSCRSDCSTSLFHSACSSVIGSISDMKPPSLSSSLDNMSLAMWSGSNSVSMESLPSSTGYCTPSEQDSFCQVADCTLSNTADSRFVIF